MLLVKTYNDPLSSIILPQDMQNRENVDPNSDLGSYNSIALMAEVEDEAAPFNSNLVPHTPENYHKNGLFSSPIDFFAAESFHTVDRGSLKILPELSGMDLQFRGESEIPFARRSSGDFDEERENDMIARTLKLCLKSSSESSIKQDLFSDYSPMKHRSLIKNRRRHHPILKNSKQLMRQLRRRVEQDRRIEVDFIIYFQKQKLRFKQAVLQPITNEKGVLSGLVLNSQQDQRRMRFSTHPRGPAQHILQLWDEGEEIWRECQFKAYL